MNRLLTSDAVRVAVTLIVLAGLILLHRQGGLEGTVVAGVLADAANNGPNEMEMDLITKNYYEQLVDVDRDPEWNFGEGWLRDWLRERLGRPAAEPGVEGGGGRRRENDGS